MWSSWSLYPDPNFLCSQDHRNPQTSPSHMRNLKVPDFGDQTWPSHVPSLCLNFFEPRNSSVSFSSSLSRDDMWVELHGRKTFIVLESSSPLSEPDMLVNEYTWLKTRMHVYQKPGWPGALSSFLFLKHTEDTHLHTLALAFASSWIPPLPGICRVCSIHRLLHVSFQMPICLWVLPWSV